MPEALEPAKFIQRHFGEEIVLKPELMCEQMVKEK
jgi:hypothetical protein